MTKKPPTPKGWNDWDRILVDTNPRSDFAIINRIAGFAATSWACNSPDGPLKKPMPLMTVVDGAVHEALLHLLELGLIDIDADRYPVNRKRQAGDDA
ncbi:hypothetical protein [Streptomyces sp. WAC08241]|uniref:hypothetical protein n=1 Tax=Streptomyces sp. WAC08241 TaxID=2487421 RepID=UPI000F785FF6|nr:hypothetical protein [Streptomyces sp. WAC08241]RSS37459.1 hypothetical protein EF906_23070 [Streptomyces sp. WAC08241]